MPNALLLKELRLAVRARRVGWAALGMTMLSAVALLVGTVEHESRVELYRSLSEYGEKSFGEQKPDHPHSIAHNGYVVVRPPAPLGYLDGGVESAYGRYVRLDAHQTRPLTGARTAELSRGPGAGRFDLGLLLAVFAPAIVVLLGFDQIAGEKARGTWAMLRSAGVRAGAMTASKSVGLAVRTLLALAPALAMTIVASSSVGDLDARTFIWLGAHVIALLVWCPLVLLLSAWARTVRGALLGGVALWAALALFLPPFAGGLARALAPSSPTGDALVKAAEWADSAHAQSEKLRSDAIRDVRRRYPEWDGTGDPPEVLDAVMLRLADAQASKKMFALFESLDAEADRQERLAALLSAFSPTGLASLASSAIAGSDVAHMRESFRHFERYRVKLMEWFNDWWAKQGAGGFDRYEAEKQFDSFQGAPRPTPFSLPLSFSLDRARFAMALLIGLGLIAHLALALSLSRQLGAPP